ncbi:MAG: Crp/Fnr family transcriptional regulator [Bacilli bacterium]|nr:Crp/Fnr family transcriptional regulator [Bacilli bacterium]
MNNIVQTLNKYPQHIEKRRFKTAETIFLENDTCKSVGIVKTGEISIKSYFANGKEVTYNTLKEGQMFGNNLIFSSTPRYRGDVIAQKESEIWFISKDNLLKLLKLDETFLLEYLTQQSDFSKTLNLKIKLLTISMAEDRLEYYLTFNKNKLTYESITKLANELYLSRESLSRTITKLVKNRKIKKIGKTLELVVQ